MQEYENIKLTIEDIKKSPCYSHLNEDELESIIEMIWEYSVIAYNTYSKSNIEDAYE